MEVGKVIKRVEDLFSFFFFLLFPFENDKNLFWVYQNGNFLPGENILRREKKSGKMTLLRQKNMPVTPLDCALVKSLQHNTNSLKSTTEPPSW